MVVAVAVWIVGSENPWSSWQKLHNHNPHNSPRHSLVVVSIVVMGIVVAGVAHGNVLVGVAEGIVVGVVGVDVGDVVMAAVDILVGIDDCIVVDNHILAQSSTFGCVAPQPQVDVDAGRCYYCCYFCHCCGGCVVVGNNHTQHHHGCHVFVVGDGGEVVVAGVDASFVDSSLDLQNVVGCDIVAGIGVVAVDYDIAVVAGCGVDVGEIVVGMDDDYCYYYCYHHYCYFVAYHMAAVGNSVVGCGDSLHGGCYYYYYYCVSVCHGQMMREMGLKRHQIGDLLKSDACAHDHHHVSGLDAQGEDRLE